MADKTTITRHYDGQAPSGSHLLLYTNPTFTVADPLVPGIMMGFVQEAGQSDYMQRMVLWKITRRSLIFKCACNPQCRAIYTYRMTEYGAHAR